MYHACRRLSRHLLLKIYMFIVAKDLISNAFQQQEEETVPKLSVAELLFYDVIYSPFHEVIMIPDKNA